MFYKHDTSYLSNLPMCSALQIWQCMFKLFISVWTSKRFQVLGIAYLPHHPSDGEGPSNSCSQSYSKLRVCCRDRRRIFLARSRSIRSDRVSPRPPVRRTYYENGTRDVSSIPLNAWMPLLSLWLHVRYARLSAIDGERPARRTCI